MNSIPPTAWISAASGSQLVGQGDQRIDRLALVVEVADCPEDDLMRITVKVADRQDRDDLVEDVIVQQDTAEHPLLGLQVLGRKPVRQQARHVDPRRAAVGVAVSVAVSVAEGGHDRARLREEPRTPGPGIVRSSRLNDCPARPPRHQNARFGHGPGAIWNHVRGRDYEPPVRPSISDDGRRARGPDETWRSAGSPKPRRKSGRKSAADQVAASSVCVGTTQSLTSVSTSWPRWSLIV